LFFVMVKKLQGRVARADVLLFPKRVSKPQIIPAALCIKETSGNYQRRVEEKGRRGDHGRNGRQGEERKLSKYLSGVQGREKGDLEPCE